MVARTRAALYTRVSTEDQAREGFSLGAQMERLRAYATAQGWDVAGEYVDDGCSGRSTSRPMYQRMLSEADSWDTILVLKMDRIHRNSENFLQMMKTLEGARKGFASVTETLDTSTAMGRFVMDIIQRIAQLESEQIGERVEVGMRQKAKTGGGSLGGHAPFGYRREDGKLVPHDEEARLVRSMFLMKDAGDDPGRIGARLTTQGHRTRQGNPWTYWNVKAILENRVYEGHTVWDGIVQHNTHPSLVPVSSVA